LKIASAEAIVFITIIKDFSDEIVSSTVSGSRLLVNSSKDISSIRSISNLLSGISSLKRDSPLRPKHDGMVAVENTNLVPPYLARSSITFPVRSQYFVGIA